MFCSQTELRESRRRAKEKGGESVQYAAANDHGAGVGTVTRNAGVQRGTYREDRAKKET